MGGRKSGVTQELVSKVCEDILKAGGEPTIRGVRAVFGTGSPNRIQVMIKVWRSGVEALVPGGSAPGADWARVEISRLKVELIKADAAAAAAQRDLAQLEDKLKRAQGEIDGLRYALGVVGVQR